MSNNIILQGITADELIQQIVDEVIKQLPTQEPTENEPQADYITIKEACNILNVSRATLHRYEKQGKIKVYGIGARRLLKRSELIESLTLKI